MFSKIALVLGGGGAKGAFQFGAISYIEEQLKPRNPSFYYSIIAGVSVGALNATMLAMTKYNELKAIWNNISSKQIYKGKINWFSVIRILFGARSVLSNRPLYEMIQRYVTLKDLKQRYDLRIGVVSLLTGQYRAFRPYDFDNDEDFRKALLASTAIPVIWEPVKEIRLKEARSFRDAVDGGIRNITPLGDVLESDPSLVIIINCSPRKERLREDPGASKNIFTIAKRALTEITIDEIFNTDINEFLRINRLVEQAEKQGCILRHEDGRPYQVFRAIIIEPEDDLGDTLDFSRNIIEYRISEGHRIAKRLLSVL